MLPQRAIARHFIKTGRNSIHASPSSSVSDSKPAAAPRQHGQSGRWQSRTHSGMMTLLTEPESAMHPLFSRIFALLALVLLMSAWPGHAAGALSALEEKNVRAVIQAQLKAFAADNARAAFALATPALQTQFGTPETFMTMVRTSYPVVYAPGNVAFLKPEARHSEVIQRVQMTDRQGKAWLAVYSLQQQKGKGWRISGCVVVASLGRSV
jgi:hypothetical protein